MARRKKGPVQFDLFGDPIEESRPQSGGLMPLDFEGRRVRVIMIKGETWWVARDVCKVLEISNVTQTVKGQERRRADGFPYWSGGLDADEWGLHSVYTPSGEQEMLCVNESGLYSLVFTSRKSDARRFRKWVTSEVLPAIRKTGSYSIADSKFLQVKRRLRCDDETANRS